VHPCPRPAPALTPKLSRQRHDFSHGVDASTATTSVVITPVPGCPWAFHWLDLWWLDLWFALSSNRLVLACSQGTLDLSAAVVDRSMGLPSSPTNQNQKYSFTCMATS
jgi:hypothetical protein